MSIILFSFTNTMFGKMRYLMLFTAARTTCARISLLGCFCGAHGFTGVGRTFG